MVDNGVIVPEVARVRVGGFDFGAGGRIDMVEQTLDLHLLVAPTAPYDRASSATDTASAMIALRGPWHSPVVRTEDAPVP
jgi:hypothetical protein